MHFRLVYPAAVGIPPRNLGDSAHAETSRICMAARSDSGRRCLHQYPLRLSALPQQGLDIRRHQTAQRSCQHRPQSLLPPRLPMAGANRSRTNRLVLYSTRRSRLRHRMDFRSQYHLHNRSDDMPDTMSRRTPMAFRPSTAA